MLLAVGLSGLSFVEVLLHDYPLFYLIVKELSTACLVASIIGFVFESVTRSRLIETVERGLQLSGDRKYGVVKRYYSRQETFQDIINDLRDAKYEVIIVGICISLFKEAEDDKVGAIRELQEVVRNAIMRGCKFTFCYWWRELNNYALRERDEDGDLFNPNAHRLLIRTNQSINDHVLPILFGLIRNEGIKSDDLAKYLQQVKIVEYQALPVLSLTFIDDKLYVAPYFAQRCSATPAEKIVGLDSFAFKFHRDHYKRLALNKRSVIPPDFVLKCISKRQDAISLIDRLPQKRVELERQKQTEDPDRYTAAEWVVNEIAKPS